MMRCSTCLKSNFSFVKETEDEIFLKCENCGSPQVIQKTDYTLPMIEKVLRKPKK